MYVTHLEWETANESSTHNKMAPAFYYLFLKDRTSTKQIVYSQISAVLASQSSMHQLECQNDP